MNILRKMLLVILAGLLPLFLFSLAIDSGIIKTAGSSAPIKKVLNDSGIYNSLISGLLDQAKTSGGDQGGGTSLTDQGVKAAAEKTFTPQFLQSTTEKILDSVFAWLDGKTLIPDYKIDVSGLKGTFAMEVAKTAEARAATLPACPPGLSGGSSFDAFSATCLPKGLTAAQAAIQVQNDINSGDGFIKDTLLSADSVKTSGSNQSVFVDQLKNAPKAYQNIKKTPIILAVLALITTLGIVFLSSSRVAGLRRAGIVFLIVGFLLLVFAWGLNYGINQKALPNLNMDNKVLQEKVRNLVSDVVASVDKTYWIFGASYAGLGVVAIGGSKFIHKRRGLPDKKEGEQTPAEPAEPARHEQPRKTAPIETPAAKPAKKNIKIQ